MVKRISFALIILLMLIVVGTSYAQIYPTISYSFDPDNFLYTYTVTITPQDDFAFGYLQIDTMVENAGVTAWTMYKPEVGGVVQEDWQTSWTTWETGHDSAIWLTGNHIDPDTLTSDWVAKFVLYAPNTAPTGGVGLTMNGGIESQYVFETRVAGPGGMIPEPAGIASLGMAVIGLGGSWFRRRRM